MENSQSLTPTVKPSRHGKHINPNYHKDYYRQNREKLLAYSQNYYGVKKLLKICLKLENKGTKNGVKKNLSHDQACVYSSNSNNLIKRKCCFFCCWLKAADGENIRLATKNKRPLY